MHNAEENRNLHKSGDDQNQSRRSQFLQHGGGQRKRNGADTVPYGYGRLRSKTSGRQHDTAGRKLDEFNAR